MSLFRQIGVVIANYQCNEAAIKDFENKLEGVKDLVQELGRKLQ